MARKAAYGEWDIKPVVESILNLYLENFQNSLKMLQFTFFKENSTKKGFEFYQT